MRSQPRDPRFDESADMRLVEFQRAALGVPAPERKWQTPIAVEGSAVDVESARPLEGALVDVLLTATPMEAVIPGAVVTVTVAITNEGVKAARDVRVTVPLPGGAMFRNGSFARDGRPLLDDAADELFTGGLNLGIIEPKSRITLLWKIGVRLGNKPLVIAPQVHAAGTAVIGAEPIVISRKPDATAPFAAEIERFNQGLYAAKPVPTLEIPPADELPIYELDEEETLEYEAAEAALSSAIPELPEVQELPELPEVPEAEYNPGVEPPIAPPPPTTQPEPAPPPDQPAPVPEPGVPVPEPMNPEPPEMPPDVEPAAREAVVLYGRMDRPSIAYFQRIFTGTKPPTLLNHFILGGALACTRSLRGDDVGGLKQHMDAQGQLLQRIVLHEKMGKKEPIGEYAGNMLARVDQFAAAPVSEAVPPEDGNAVLLEAELEAPTLAVLRKMQDESARWDFTKARQLTLALQARRIISNAPKARVESAEEALRVYAQTAATQLQKFFVRMRIDRTTGLLYAHDETLDAAAQNLIAALAALF